MGKFDERFRKSIEDPEGFWGEAAEAVTWYKKWDKVLDAANPPFYRWFTGGELNTCYNALDRHVESGRADQTALIYDSPVTKTIQKFTYRELLDTVSALRRGLEKPRSKQRGYHSYLYADDTGSSGRNARLRPSWRSPFSCIWWICPARTCLSELMMPNQRLSSLHPVQLK